VRLFRRREDADSLSAEVQIALLRLPEDIGPWIEQVNARVLRELRAEAAGDVFESDAMRVAAEAIDGAWIAWEDSPGLVSGVLPAFFDKLLANLADSPWLAQALAGSVERHLKREREPGKVPFAEVVPLVGLSDDLLAVEVPSGMPIQNFALDAALRQGMIEEAEANVIVRATVLHDHKRLGAETYVEPQELTHPMLGELAFWAVWDWVYLSLAGAAQPTALDVLRACLMRQCELYRERGFPTPLEVGLTPYAAAAETGLVKTD